MVMSSAKESMCMSGCAEIGASCMKRLKKVGESTDPWALHCGSVSLWILCHCGLCRRVYL